MRRRTLLVSSAGVLGAIALAFINHGPQSPKNTRPSDITRRRYWRVLDRVYDHAVLHRWAASNPAQGITAQDMPPSEDPKGAVLSARMWRALERQAPVPGLG